MRVNGADVTVPEVHEDLSATDIAVGIRPEHIRLEDIGALHAIYLRALENLLPA